jgi:glycosyltransferase involved in cell wall biosynthesis
VLEGKTGHLLDAGDSAALGDAIEALVIDSNRRRSMGEHGRADALQRFDARENARRLFEFVRSHC